MMVQEVQVCDAWIYGCVQLICTQVFCIFFYWFTYWLCFYFCFLTDGIVSFLKKQAGPPSLELKSEEDLEKFTANQDAGVVGELICGHLHLLESLLDVNVNIFCVSLCFWIFPGFFSADSTAQAEFLKAANTLRDNYRFAHTNSEALLQSHGIDGE